MIPRSRKLTGTILTNIFTDSEEALYIKTFLITSDYYCSQAILYIVVPLVQDLSQVTCLQGCLMRAAHFRDVKHDI